MGRGGWLMGKCVFDHNHECTEWDNLIDCEECWFYQTNVFDEEDI